jgi:hypothetical protein
MERPKTNFCDWLESKPYQVVYDPKRDELYEVENYIATMNGKEYFIHGNGRDKLFGSWKQTKFCTHWVWLGEL